ncbi:MAG: nucleotidyltransferase family protein [Faecalibacterium sp.]|nr:nucleotidyltransferase family protein [Faecalibacterium sp.]
MNDINFTMYKLAGIIAEYDPFHNGHAWQLQQAKALGAQRVAVAMSCGLTQRGALPLLPESVRVQAALTCGADLVFALPAPYACSGAECFARAGVQLLAAAGCDALVFGAETPDAALLMEAARVLSGAEYRTALKARLAAGARSFAAARQAAVEAVCPDTGLAALLDKPNNNLAVEYCKAILELGASLVPIPLPRQGAGHGQALTETGGQFASASALRTLWQNGGADAAAPYVPAEVLPLYREAFAAGQYTDLAAAQRCQLALLRSRCAGAAPFAQVRGISEGLEHRLEAAVRSSTTHAELLDSLTTVRYPRARMRRLAMDAALGYSADVFPALPPYLHLLGAQKDALSLLKAAALPVSHSLARLAEQNAPCRAVVDAQLRACDFGALCRKKPEPMGSALRQKIIFLTK